MTINKLFPAKPSSLGILACLSLCALRGASLPGSGNVGLTAAARITSANYCFARVRKLTPERQPPSYRDLHGVHPRPPFPYVLR